MPVGATGPIEEDPTWTIVVGLIFSLLIGSVLILLGVEVWETARPDANLIALVAAEFCIGIFVLAFLFGASRFTHELWRRWRNVWP